MYLVAKKFLNQSIKKNVSVSQRRFGSLKKGYSASHKLRLSTVQLCSYHAHTYLRADKKDYVDDILDDVDEHTNNISDNLEELAELGKKKNMSSTEQVTQLETEYSELSDQLKLFKERLDLSESEKDNITRITNLDVEKAKEFPIKKFANEIFNVMDTLDLCIQNIPASKSEHPEIAAARKELLSVKDRFKSMMERDYQVTQIETTVGDKFDPDVHDAIFEMPAHGGTPTDGNVVGAIIKSGWSRKGILVRPVHVGVIVARK